MLSAVYQYFVPSPLPPTGERRGWRLWRHVLPAWGIIALATFATTLVAAYPPPAVASPRHAVVLEIDGAIGPATAGYVSQAIATVDANDTGIIIIRMDTPGGLDSSMRDIIRAILASPVPVAAYVAPSGARAASAGTYIVYASSIAAMAPGTNLGAATPVQLRGLPLLPEPEPSRPTKGTEGREPSASSKTQSAPGGEPDDAESRKILNDATAYIRSLADLNGRNADWAAEAVRRAVSLPASDALKLHVIDVVADDIPDLLRQIDGRTVTVQGRQVQLATTGLTTELVVPGWRTQILAVITRPDMAYLLMLLGMLGLAFELATPGTVLPGTIGAISLFVGLFGLNLLPINYAGAGLVLLGIALLVTEAFVGAFGVLAVGGLASFIIGSLMMFQENAPGFELSLSVVLGAAIASTAFCLLVIAMLLRSRRRPVVTGGEALIGAEGTTVEWEGMSGRVRVAGEIWLAKSLQTVQAGDPIKVIKRDGLLLIVEPKGQTT
jgi:membrane-bound serine protease (ClpP class)